MPAPTSDSLNSETRHKRAKEMMLRQSDASEGAARTGQSRISTAAQDQQKPARAPKRSDGDKIDKVLAALAGKTPQAQDGQRGLEADPANAGRSQAGQQTADDDRSEPDNTPPGSWDQQRPAFELDDDDDLLDEPERKTRKVKARTLGEFADELEVAPKAIYDLSLTVSDGETPVTIGQLKDHYKATRDFETRAQEFEDYRVQSQNEIIRGRNELDDVLGRIAAVVPRKDMEHILVGVRDQTAQLKARAEKELREFFPEWDDDVQRRKAGNKMRGWLVSYGIPAEALNNLYDAKVIRMLWHMGNKAERYMTLKAGEREKRPSTEPRASRRKPPPTPNETARERVLKGDKVGAVAALLMGKSNGHDKS